MIRGKLKESIWPALLAGFTLFGFGAWELYLTNAKDFWFSFGSVAPCLAGLMLACVVLLCAALAVLPRRVFPRVLLLLYSIAFGLYIQGNYLPNGFGTLNGVRVHWMNYKTRLALTSLVWLAVIVLPQVLYPKLRRRLVRVLKVLAVVVLLTEVVTLVVLHVQPREKGRANLSYLCIDDAFTLSEKQNTVVILLDCFDADLMQRLIATVPDEVNKTFEDFTYYHDTCGGATRTKYAIPYIFCGQTNTAERSYNDYLKDAYAASPFFRELAGGGYDVRLLTYAPFVDMSRTDAVDNIATGIPSISSHLGLTLTYAKLTCYRYMPQILKPLFWMYSGDFDRWNSNRKGGAHAEDDPAFYRRLTEERLSAAKEEPAFRFYHLKGAHPAYDMDEECNRVGAYNVREEVQARGCMKIIREFIAQLKALGLYDSTAFYVMADHGSINVEQNPLFLFKERGERHAFREDPTPLSFADMPAMFTRSVRGEALRLTDDFAVRGPRYFYEEKEANGVISINEYVIDGPAYDFANTRPTGRVYHGDSQHLSRKYTLGTRLSFGREETGNHYTVKGILRNQGDVSWLEGYENVMAFELEGAYRNLSLEFAYADTKRDQAVRITAGGYSVAEFNAFQSGWKHFVIPGEAVKDGVLELKFETPNARGKTRPTSLALTEMTIASTDEAYTAAK